MPTQSPTPPTPDQTAPVPAGPDDVIAAFEEQARADAADYGYPPEKAELFTKVRTFIAHLAVEQFGITKPEDITEDMIKDIAMTASPQLAEELSSGQEERRQLKRLIEIDTLTGVGSRHAFEAAKETAEADENVAFIELDADKFKQVNDTLGHDTGDEALVDIAQHALGIATEYGVGERLFRIGGDEFVILAPAAEADEILERIVTTFGGEGMMSYGDNNVSLSGGVGKDFAEADEQLYKVKEAKKQSV